MSEAQPLEATTLQPIYTRVEQHPPAVELIDGALELSGHADRFASIESKDQAAVAAEYLARNRKHVKLLDEERLEMTRGARETIERINKKFNERIDDLRSKDKIVSGALTVWIRKEEQEAREAQAAERARLVAAAEKTGTEVALPAAAPPPSKTLHGSHGSTVTLRDNWKWRVTNIADVPETFLVAPEERIQRTMMNSAAKAKAKAFLARWTEEHPNTPPPIKLSLADLPGIELYNEPTNATSTF
jgi:hypothetical protein